jgi:hypothetical protein
MVSGLALSVIDIGLGTRSDPIEDLFQPSTKFKAQEERNASLESV